MDSNDFIERFPHVEGVTRAPKSKKPQRKSPKKYKYKRHLEPPIDTQLFRLLGYQTWSTDREKIPTSVVQIAEQQRRRKEKKNKKHVGQSRSPSRLSPVDSYKFSDPNVPRRRLRQILRQAWSLSRQNEHRYLEKKHIHHKRILHIHLKSLALFHICSADAPQQPASKCILHLQLAYCYLNGEDWKRAKDHAKKALHAMNNSKKTSRRSRGIAEEAADAADNYKEITELLRIYTQYIDHTHYAKKLHKQNFLPLYDRGGQARELLHDRSLDENDTRFIANIFSQSYTAFMETLVGLDSGHQYVDELSLRFSECELVMIWGLFEAATSKSKKQEDNHEQEYEEEPKRKEKRTQQHKRCVPLSQLQFAVKFCTDRLTRSCIDLEQLLQCLLGFEEVLSKTTRPETNEQQTISGLLSSKSQHVYWGHFLEMCLSCRKDCSVLQSLILEIFSRCAYRRGMVLENVREAERGIRTAMKHESEMNNVKNIQYSLPGWLAEILFRHAKLLKAQGLIDAEENALHQMSSESGQAEIKKRAIEIRMKYKKECLSDSVIHLTMMSRPESIARARSEILLSLKTEVFKDDIFPELFQKQMNLCSEATNLLADLIMQLKEQDIMPFFSVLASENGEKCQAVKHSLQMEAYYDYLQASIWVFQKRIIEIAKEHNVAESLSNDIPLPEALWEMACDRLRGIEKRQENITPPWFDANAPLWKMINVDLTELLLETNYLMEGKAGKERIPSFILTECIERINSVINLTDASLENQSIPIEDMSGQKSHKLREKIVDVANNLCATLAKEDLVFEAIKLGRKIVQFVNKYFDDYNTAKANANFHLGCLLGKRIKFDKDLTIDEENDTRSEAVSCLNVAKKIFTNIQGQSSTKMVTIRRMMTNFATRKKREPLAVVTKSSPVKQEQRPQTLQEEEEENNKTITEPKPKSKDIAPPVELVQANQDGQELFIDNENQKEEKEPVNTVDDFEETKVENVVPKPKVSLYSVGTAVECMLKGWKAYFKGIVVKEEDDQYTIHFADGERHENISENEIKPMEDTVETSFQVGDKVLATVLGWNTFYDGVIVNVGEKGLYDIRFADGDF
eukprot:g2004.t1